LSWVVPRWLRILLLVIAVAVVSGLVVPYFLDFDRYRPLVVLALEAETGRRVTIGKLRARLLPSLGFVLENLTLSSPPGFGESKLLSAEAVRGSLAWGPLLRREFQLRSVELVHPKLMLLEDGRGQTNYRFGRKKVAGPAPRETSPAASLALIKLSDAELKLARVSGGGRNIVLSLRVSKVNTKLSNIAFGSALPREWTADGNLAGVCVELSVLVAPIQFRSGRFALRNGAVESKFEAELGKAGRVKGSLHVADIERPVATFELSTPLIDLGQLVATGVETGTPRSVPAAEDSPTPKSGELVAQGRVTAQRLRWAPYEATQATAEVRIFTDRVEVWPAMMALYGGSLGVSAWLERHREAAGPDRFSSNIQARNLDVGQLLAASPATRGKMNGTGELTLQVFGCLGPAWMNSLTGTGTFGVRDGRFPGFHLGEALQTLAKVQRALNLGNTRGPNAATSFSLIQGDLNIGQGRVRSNRIHLDSPSGTVDLSGSFGLAGGLDYVGQAVLVPGSGGNGQNPAGILSGVLAGVMGQSGSKLSIPFSLRGTFHDLRLEPGRALPSLQTASPNQPAAVAPERKKTILDLFRRP